MMPGPLRLLRHGDRRFFAGLIRLPPGTPPSRADVAQMLDELAARSGDAAFRRAAEALERDHPGRPQVDDSVAIAETKALLATGDAATLNEAIRLVVRQRVAPLDRRAAFERIRRKLQKACTK